MSKPVVQDTMFLKDCIKISKERQLKTILLTNLKEVKVEWLWMLQQIIGHWMKVQLKLSPNLSKNYKT